jgi:hypothetical protein
MQSGGLPLTADGSSTVAILLSVIALIWQSIQFFLTRSSDAKNRQFEAYHRLVKELVQPSENGKTYVDRQCAALFELRRFKDYKDVTVRILVGLRDDWRKDPNLTTRLAREIDLTLDSLLGVSPTTPK